MRLSNAKAVQAIRDRQIFDNNGSTLAGVRRFRGWGLLDSIYGVHDVALERVYYWVYSYDTPIAWIYENGEPHMPSFRFSRVTLHHQKTVAEALGLDVNPIDWPLAHPLAGAR